MNHTTNPIDAKIEPQIVLTVDNLFDSFFIVILAFKGQFSNFFSQCSRLTYLNLCVIESRA